MLKPSVFIAFTHRTRQLHASAMVFTVGPSFALCLSSISWTKSRMPQVSAPFVFNTRASGEPNMDVVKSDTSVRGGCLLLA
eukprot:7226075-Alexandrium_andersonii.AAC.1